MEGTRVKSEMSDNWTFIVFWPFASFPTLVGVDFSQRIPRRSEPSYEKDILGKTVRIPRWELGDFFIAIFLTTIIMLLINMVHSGSSIGVVKMIGIFIAMMIFIKLLGYMLICAAGPECITYHDRIGGSYADALEAGAGAGALAMVWKLMKMRRGI